MLLRAGGAAAALTLAVPSLVFAAYNDVTLTTSAVLSVNGITLNVSGSSAVVESITVNATNFTVTMPSGASFQVTAPNLERLTTDTLAGVTSNICSTRESTLGYQTTSGVTATITPVTPTCASASTGGGSGGGGGGGGGTSVSTTPVSPAATATSTATSSSVASTTPAAVTTVTPTVSALPASGLTATQVQSILDVLASFNVDAATMASVRLVLEGTSSGSVTSAAVRVFKSNLTLGSLGSEVKALQQFLNSHGYPVASQGPGSPGNETSTFGAATRAALMSYQKAKGIKPVSGYFGPKTRATINAEPN